MTEDQDRKAFEEAMAEEGFYTPLRRIGPEFIRAGEYAEVITQACWQVWQRALEYAKQKKYSDEKTL